MSKPVPVRDCTTNWSSYNAELRQRGSLLVWLNREIEWLAPASGRVGRPQTFSGAAIRFYLSIKVLFSLALRQTIGMVASLLRMAGVNWPVPDDPTLCRRPNTVAIQVPCGRSGRDLNLLVDSTGVKMGGEGEWQVRRHGASHRRQSRKVHLAMDVATVDLRGVEFTSSREGGSLVLPDLLAQIPSDQPIGTVTTDGALTPERVTPPSLSVVPSPSSPSARTAVPGGRTAPPPRQETRPCRRPGASAGASGRD